MRRVISVITVYFMIATMFSGCGMMEKLGFGKEENDEMRPVSSVVMGEEEAKKLTDKFPVRLYFANEDNSKLKLEIRYIPVSDAKKGTAAIAGWIVNELINGPVTNKDLVGTIPKSAQLRGPVTIEAGVATVDLTKDFLEKHTGGKDAEKMTIYSIVNSLTELKDIQKVKFHIDGKTRSDFNGHFKFDEAFPRAAQIISREVNQPDAATFDIEENIEETSVDGIEGEPGDENIETFEELSEEEIVETFNEPLEDEFIETFDEGFEAEYIEYLE